MPRILKRPMFSRGGRIGLAEGDPNPGMMGRLGSALPKEKYKPDLMTIKATLNQVYTNAGGSEDGSGYAAVLNFMKENPEYKVQILENMIADKGNQIRVAPLEKESVNILDSLNEDMDGIIKIDMDKLGGRLSENDIQRQQQESNKGIMTGLVDRTELSNGSPFTAERTSADVKAMMDAMNEYAPVTKQRLNLGKVGLNLASGKYSGGDLISTLAGAGSDIYDDYTTKDDAYRAALAKRKQAAVSSSLAQQLKEASVKPKDARTNLMKELEAIYGKDSPQYKAALEKLVLKDLKPKDTRTEEMIMLEEIYGKDSPEYKAALERLVLKDFIPRAGFRTLTLEEIKNIKGLDKEKAYQINTDPRSKDFNKIFEIGGSGTSIKIGIGEGEIQGKAARDEIVNATNFVQRQLRNLDSITALLNEDPTLSGGVGAIKKFAFDTLSLAKDFNFDITPAIKNLGGEDILLNSNTARLEALQDILVPAFARVMNPNTRITNQMLNEAKSAINLTGLKGSDAVKTKLKEITNQFKTYIDDQNKLLGKSITGEKTFKEDSDGVFRLQ